MWEEKSCIYDIRPKAFGTIFFEKNIFLRNEGFILAWEIPWIEEPGGLQSMGLQKSDMTEATEHAQTIVRVVMEYLNMTTWLALNTGKQYN